MRPGRQGTRGDGVAVGGVGLGTLDMQSRATGSEQCLPQPCDPGGSTTRKPRVDALSMRGESAPACSFRSPRDDARAAVEPGQRDRYVERAA